LPKWLLWPIYLTTLLIGLATIAWLFSWPNHSYYAAPVIGSLIVALGWIVASENTIRNSQHDQTIKAILSLKGPENERCWKLILKDLPGANDVLALPDSGLIYSESNRLYDAVDNLLNEFDFIALGARKGVYDRRMLRSALENDFITLYDLAANYISHTQRVEGDGEIWLDFCRLSTSWKKSAERTSTRRRAKFRLAMQLSWCLGYVAGRLSRRT
jgi:hypothetical protein